LGFGLIMLPIVSIKAERKEGKAFASQSDATAAVYGSLYRAATSGLVAAAREVKDKGTFGYVDTSLPSAEVAGFMRE